MMGISSLLPLLFIKLHLFVTFHDSYIAVNCVNWSESTKWPHSLKLMTDGMIQSLVVTDTSHYQTFNNTLDSILIPRVPGTEGHAKVKEFIVNSMKSLNWDVEEDSFTSKTPHGVKPFTNIIATLNSYACRRLVLACHYDSLYNREYTFLGATDSAVPCAMMIHLAEMLDSALKQQKEKDTELTLQFIFFDGEEAFKKWSRTDSLYGSKHLAEKWSKIPFQKTREMEHCRNKDFINVLEGIDVFVLLDLLGGANPQFYSYFLDTHSLYMQLVAIEQRLNSMRYLERQPPEGNTAYFNSRSIMSFIEDDHVPFMKRDVPIIHVIPSPFPPVWHRESDNKANLHNPTINNLNKIFTVFVSQYLHLNISDSSNPS